MEKHLPFSATAVVEVVYYVPLTLTISLGKDARAIPLILVG